MDRVIGQCRALRHALAWLIPSGMLWLGMSPPAGAEYIKTKIDGTIWIENKLNQALHPQSGFNFEDFDDDPDIESIALSMSTWDLAAGKAVGSVEVYADASFGILKARGIASATGGHQVGEAGLFGGLFIEKDVEFRGDVTALGRASATLQVRLYLIPANPSYVGKQAKVTAKWLVSGKASIDSPYLTSKGHASWTFFGNIGGGGFSFDGGISTCVNCGPDGTKEYGDSVGLLTKTYFPKWGSSALFTQTLSIEAKAYSYMEISPYSAITDFSQTLIWGGVTATDLSGNHVTDYKVLDEYGNDWTNAFTEPVSTAPEPSALFLMCSGAIVAAATYRRRVHS